MEDLFAALDSRDKQTQQESITESQGTLVNKVIEERIEAPSRKQNSKVRHLARQVSGA